MAANVLYFGPDEWNRVQVLESAGYAVHQCLKVSDLESALRQPPQPAVVVMNSFGRANFKPAIEIIHAEAAATPVIVFPGPGETGFEKSVDLVVPPLTSPDEWLKEMAELLDRSRGLLEDAMSLQEQSATLTQQVAEAKAQSAETRAQSAATRADSAETREKSAEIRANFLIEREKSERGKVPASRRVAGSTNPTDPEEEF